MVTKEFLGRPAEILLVEDNEGDIVLAREALEESKFINNLHVVQDGVEAMTFLRKEGPYAEKPRPDLILLDLNLPRKTGHEVLKEIKNDEHLRQIPVCILTVSDNEKDILETYDQHANCFITKPVQIDRFIEIVQQIEDFWFAIVTLPKKGEAK
jgi:two-component system, chemotaxis family, response regulator Rcp1